MRRVFAILIGWCVLAPVDIDAHHSGSEYDRTIVEIEGELLEVAWQNPHVHSRISRCAAR
jgi:hypothetical protein